MIDSKSLELTADPHLIVRPPVNAGTPVFL